MHFLCNKLKHTFFYMFLAVCYLVNLCGNYYLWNITYSVYITVYLKTLTCVQTQLPVYLQKSSKLAHREASNDLVHNRHCKD